MNFRNSLVSDEEDVWSVASGKQDLCRSSQKQPSKTTNLKLRTSHISSSLFDNDDDEEEDNAVPFRQSERSLVYSNDADLSVLSSKKTKKGVLDKLARMGSQRAVSHLDSKAAEVPEVMDGTFEVGKRTENNAGWTESESAREAEDLECSEGRISPAEDSIDDSAFIPEEEVQEDSNNLSPLENLLKRQASVLQDFRVCTSRKKRKKTKSEVIKSASGTLSIEERWEIDRSFLAPDFLKSKEAKMEITERVRKGIRAYEGLKISHENCHDMKSVYEVDFAPVISAGLESKTYEQFKVTIGQYARMCVTLKKCKLNTLCEPGNLFRLICEKPLAEAFLGYFQIRAAPATVTQKENTLVRLADNAYFYFRTQNPELSTRAEVTARYIRKTSASHKRLTKHRMKEKQDINRRIEEGRLFTEADFALCSERAAEVLRKCAPSIKKYVSDLQSASKAKSGERPQRISYEKQIVSLVNKWCINFLCLLIMNGAGQRTQVYAELSLPTYAKMKLFREESAEHGYFEISTIHERTTRNIDCPYVIFPASTFKFISFHVKYVRDIIVRVAKIDESNVLYKTLMLHTGTGNPLDSNNVNRTLKLFLGLVDPEHSDVSVMTLRASYATIMLQKHRSGELMQHKTEEQFLEYLSKVMNTSVEQLRATYASSSRSSFRDCAREVATIMDSNIGDRFLDLSD